MITLLQLPAQTNKRQCSSTDKDNGNTRRIERKPKPLAHDVCEERGKKIGLFVPRRQDAIEMSTVSCYSILNN